jgi:ABC-2 type transport system permease protein
MNTLTHNINAVFTIAFRDITKLLRDKGRIMGSLIFPIIFIGVLGTSLQSNLEASLQYNFLTFVFLGVLAQTLFQSTAGGIISLVEDRQNDFAQEIFISPISRYSIILGKILGETMVSFIQLTGVIIFGFIFGIPLSLMGLLKLFPFGILIALFGGAFGLIVMSKMNNQRSANQIFPFLLFPQFFLAGVFNPIKILPFPLMIASRIAPMTYAVDLMRSVYYYGTPEYQHTVLYNPFLNFVVCAILTLIFITLGTYWFVKSEREK